MKVTDEYVFGKASDFSKSEVERFKNIVINAGEVTEVTFDGLLEKDPILLFIPNPIKIQAVGALKIPNDEYKVKVFTKSKTTENSMDYQFELGWVVSLTSGNGKKLVEILSQITPNIYATVRCKNNKMKHILEKFRFAKSGQSYKSDINNYEIELYLKGEKKEIKTI